METLMNTHSILPPSAPRFCLRPLRRTAGEDDYDHKVEFGQYKTYSWKKSNADPLWSTVSRPVNAALTAKGWRRSSRAEASHPGDEMAQIINSNTYYDAWEAAGAGGIGDSRHS